MDNEILEPSVNSPAQELENLYLNINGVQYSADTNRLKRKRRKQLQALLVKGMKQEIGSGNGITEMELYQVTINQQEQVEELIYLYYDIPKSIDLDDGNEEELNAVEKAITLLDPLGTLSKKKETSPT